MLSSRVWVMNSAKVGVLVAPRLPQCSHWHLEEGVVPLPPCSWPAVGSGCGGVGVGASQEAGTLVGVWPCPAPCSPLLPPPFNYCTLHTPQGLYGGCGWSAGQLHCGPVLNLLLTNWPSKFICTVDS